MRDLIKTIFKSTEDRLRNPFIGTFITSWVVFNWKPILYLLFSTEIIRDRITYVSSCYNDVWCYLWLPLIFAILYNSVLPYLSLLFEYLVSFSIKSRNDVSLKAKKAILALQIEIEKNAITLEEEKTTFRERKSHNAMVENLQDQVGLLNLKLEEANHNSFIIGNTALLEKEDNLKILNQTIKSYEDKVGLINEELSQEKSKNKEITKESSEDRSLLAKYELTIQNLNDQLAIEKFKVQRFKNPINKIIGINNLIVLEYFTPSNDIIYYEINERSMIDIQKITNLHVNNKILEKNNNQEALGVFENLMLNNMSISTKLKYGIKP